MPLQLGVDFEVLDAMNCLVSQLKKEGSLGWAQSWVWLKLGSGLGLAGPSWQRGRKKEKGMRWEERGYTLDCSEVSDKLERLNKIKELLSGRVTNLKRL